MTTPTSASIIDLPYLTPDIPGVAATIKRSYEDFIVEEVPAYEPSGEGSHVYFRIEKRGLSTMRAVQDIAKALGVGPRHIGLAGMKDARGVTVQTLSLEHADAERIKKLEIPRIAILDVSHHTNKLKVGHLRGNHFTIRMRDVDPDRLDDVRRVAGLLADNGVPNYFGSQRFGLRGDTWELGRAVLQQDAQTLIDLMLGKPTDADTGKVLQARQLYEKGKYDEAARTWPHAFRDNARAARAMAKSKGNPKRAIFAIDNKLKRFYVNAYQSYLFNQVLARRIEELGKLYVGDLAYKHETGSVFRVEDEAAENARASAKEISPTGPLFGKKMTRAEGTPGTWEQEVLDREGVKLGDFSNLRQVNARGSRRPLRFFPTDLHVSDGRDDGGLFVELSFFLPSGCYATMLLREISKGKLSEGRSDTYREPTDDVEEDVATDEM